MKSCAMTVLCLTIISALFLKPTLTLSRAGIGIGLPIDSDPVRDCISDLRNYYATSDFYYKFSLQPRHQLPRRIFFLQIGQYPNQVVPLKTLEITGMALWGDADVAFVLTRIFRDNQQYCKNGLLHLKYRYLTEINQKSGHMYKQDLKVAYTYLNMYWTTMRHEERVMLARWWLLYPATKELPASLSDFHILKHHHKKIRELIHE